MNELVYVSNFGDVKVSFNKSWATALNLVTDIKNSDAYTDVVFSSNKKADNKEREKELEEFSQFIKDFHKDITLLINEDTVSNGYKRKKNGKFKMGTVLRYKLGINCGMQDCENEKLWHTLVIFGKALSENEIEICVGTTWVRK